jgi:hypothetical protein
MPNPPSVGDAPQKLVEALTKIKAPQKIDWMESHP